MFFFLSGETEGPAKLAPTLETHMLPQPKNSIQGS